MRSPVLWRTRNNSASLAQITFDVFAYLHYVAKSADIINLCHVSGGSCLWIIFVDPTPVGERERLLTDQFLKAADQKLAHRALIGIHRAACEQVVKSVVQIGDGENERVALHSPKLALGARARDQCRQSWQQITSGSGCGSGTNVASGAGFSGMTEAAGATSGMSSATDDFMR